MIDYVFVTHLPAFYKVNLYNRLARRLKIYVIFVGSSSKVRTADFVGMDRLFDHEILHLGDFESRPRVHSGMRLLKTMSRLSYRKLVVGGWDLAEFWIAVLASRKEKNAIVVESTMVESAIEGMKAVAKKMFLARVDTAFPAGGLHQHLLTALRFQGRSVTTGGVGLIEPGEPAGGSQPYPSSFVYAGRLAPEKNLRMLIEVFNELPQLRLTIVGGGPQERQLKDCAKRNVTFLPHVANREIGKVYSRHDCLILPSLKEPWGLVVEEALAAGLPVIVSRNAGCHTELVREGQTGITFDPESKDDLKRAIRQISHPETYRRMLSEVAAFRLRNRDDEQCAAYERANGIES